jgi:iron(III) transport system ATP-binding protein
LSGGQQQRVALARALIVEPETLLLDEPLSNLDANLREEMRFEVRRLHDAYRYTTVYVTHDQSEAMTTADLIAVMNGGRIEQAGSPEEIYSRPATRWMAEFIGEIEALPGEARDGRAACELGSFPVDEGITGPVDVLVRPESLAMGLQGPQGAPAAEVVSRRFFGHDQLVELRLPSGRVIRSRRLGFPPWHPGDRVDVWVDGPTDVLPRG